DATSVEGRGRGVPVVPLPRDRRFRLRRRPSALPARAGVKGARGSRTPVASYSTRRGRRDSRPLATIVRGLLRPGQTRITLLASAVHRRFARDQVVQRKRFGVEEREDRVAEGVRVVAMTCAPVLLRLVRV